MNASEVRQVGSDVSATVVDAAADLASKAQEGAAAAVAGARVVADGDAPTRHSVGRRRRSRRVSENAPGVVRSKAQTARGVLPGGRGRTLDGRCATSCHPRGAVSCARGGHRDRIAQ